jgi:hypothetical protein
VSGHVVLGPARCTSCRALLYWDGLYWYEVITRQPHDCPAVPPHRPYGHQAFVRRPWWRIAAEVAADTVVFLFVLVAFLAVIVVLEVGR